jgi:hypothetical protein
MDKAFGDPVLLEQFKIVQATLLIDVASNGFVTIGIA